MNEDEASAYFRRSYGALDGLWFMKVEERFGFEVALDIDREVWEVMPKIQARMLKAMTGEESGLTALLECLTTKLHWEGYLYDSGVSDDGKRLDLKIRECPWHRLLVTSGREGLAARVGPRICGTEYGMWASEFGGGIRFSLESTICQGAPRCLLRFEEEAGTSRDDEG